MNIQDAGKILGIASGFDRFIEVSQLNTTVWHKILEDHDYEITSSAIIGWYTTDWDGKTQLHPKELLGRIRRLTQAHQSKQRRTEALESLPRLRQALEAAQAEPDADWKSCQPAQYALDHATMLSQEPDTSERVITTHGKISPSDEWMYNR